MGDVRIDRRLCVLLSGGAKCRPNDLAAPLTPSGQKIYFVIWIRGAAGNFVLRQIRILPPRLCKFMLAIVTNGGKTCPP